MEALKFSSSLEISITYIHLNKGEDKPLIVIFHGFIDSAKSVLSRVYPEPDPGYEVLAINGPFPIPQKKEGGWKHAFAWYFADANTVYIPPSAAVKAVTELIHHLGLQNRKKILIGFSQGGFFLPHLHLKNVRHMIAIGSAYRAEHYAAIESVSLDALHGSDDDIIPLSQAKQSFETLKHKNSSGHFIEFAGMAHTMNSEARAWVQKKIKKVFDEAES